MSFNDHPLWAAGAGILTFASVAGAQPASTPQVAVRSAIASTAATSRITAAPANSTVASSNAEIPSKGPPAVTLKEVVVTGSRVITSEANSPTPLTVIDMRQMSLVTPGPVANQLNQLPQMAGEQGQFTNPGGGGLSSGPTAPDPAANVINLLNLGYTRTLVLMNGQRVAPISPSGEVDIDMIPQMLLQRVDVITGGASAVYGSGAVAGVVNFVTNDHFNGIEIDGQGGISNFGDEGTEQLGIAGGRNLFGGRGHVEFELDGLNDPGIPNRDERPCCSDQPTVENLTGGAYGPYQLFHNVRDSNTSFGGYIAPAFNPASDPLTGMNFASNSILSPFANGTPIASGVQSGGDGTYSDSTLKAQLQMVHFYGRLDYDFTDNVHGFFDVMTAYDYNWQQSAVNTLGTPNSGNDVAISATDPYLPAQYQQELASAGVSTFKLAKAFTDIPPSNISTWERTYSVNGGLDVALSHGYLWQIEYTQSQDQQNTVQNDNINRLKQVAAVNTAVNPANNQIVCAVSLTAYAGLYPGCTPLDPFGPTSESQPAINYILGRTGFTSYTKMDDVSTSLTGAPLTIWDGPVAMALSGDWRRLSYTLESPDAPNGLHDLIDCAGLPSDDCTVSSSGQTWATPVSAPEAPVSESVGELAYEFDAPLIKNAPLAKDVSLNGAVRFTDYSTSGTVYSWKVGLVWKINSQLTLRGTRSRDINAPSLSELYLPATYGVSVGFDNITGTNLGLSPVPDVTQGNPNLKPEIGDTTTAGLVYTPHWTHGLTLTADAFFINISDAITAIQGNSTTAQAGCVASGGSSILCQLVQRPISCCSTSPANTVTEFLAEDLNIGSEWTQGADFDADWNGDVAGHPAGLRLLATFQPHLVYDIPGTPQYNQAGVAFNNGAEQATPVWRLTMVARYSPVRNFSIEALEHWRSSMTWGPAQTPPYIFNMPPIASFATTDLTLMYTLPGSGAHPAEVYVNTTDLFNSVPPTAAFFNNGTPGTFGGFAIGDNPEGRYFNVGFRVRL